MKLTPTAQLINDGMPFYCVHHHTTMNDDIVGIWRLPDPTASFLLFNQAQDRALQFLNEKKDSTVVIVKMQGVEEYKMKRQEETIITYEPAIAHLVNRL